MSDFLKALHSGRVLLMDGAMGTELQRAGIGEAECYEMWNLTHPEKVRAIHRSYVFAGAECLVTNTFQGNRASLAKHGLQDKLEEINEAGVLVARSAAGVKHFVLGDIGPDEELFSDEDFTRMIRSLQLADALLFETCRRGSAYSCVFQAQDPQVNPNGLPILISFSYRRNILPSNPERYFITPSRVATLAHEYGVAALGVNCGQDVDLDEVVDILKEYRQETDVPLFVRPNAGTPKRVGNRWEYPITPAMMAERLPELLEAGVSMVGGCCGTTPEHIAAFRPIIDKWNARIK
jgi:5-methyltetrahydrofolate--homocysteine methyltransferase